MSDSVMITAAEFVTTLSTNIAAVCASTGTFSAARLSALDRTEAYPEMECKLLDEWGAPRAFVPSHLGGLPGDIHDLFRFLTALAERDLTLAVGYGKTFLGAVSVWCAGTPDQQRFMAHAITREKAIVSWGLTEPDRGSDLLSGTFTATQIPGGDWELSGTKWPINNATRGRMVCVLARTESAGGPRGFTFFLVDKLALTPDMWTTLPKEPTHGIRGADISGISFTQAVVKDSARVGLAGSGLEVALNALQITRTVAVSLSLGATQHALDLVAQFAAERELYGRRLASLPHAAHILGRAQAALDLQRAASTTALGHAHALPEEMSVVSALIKGGAPSIAQSTITELAQLLGARSFTVTGYQDGMFQKLERDHRIVSIFDGTTAVNRAGIISQFPNLTRGYRKHTVDMARLLQAARAHEANQPVDYSALALLSRSGCMLLNAIPALADGLASAHGQLQPLAVMLVAELDGTIAGIEKLRPPDGHNSPRAFHLAARLEVLFMAAAVLLQEYGVRDLPPAARSHKSARAEAALWRALEELRPGTSVPPHVYQDSTVTR